MERLWAPWRLSYIRGDAAPPQELPPVELLPGAAADCFLCQGSGLPRVAAGIPADQAADDRQRLVVERRDHALTMLNQFPYNNGHLLIAPRLHKASLAELSDAEHLEIAHSIRQGTAWLTQLMQPDGFNIGLNLGRTAGAGVPGHLHWHVVPRWNGDANFMSVTADARVISQSLDELWTLLAEVREFP